MAKAIWKGKILAESDRTRIVEGNYYFPPDAVSKQYFEGSEAHSTCVWKGVASYYNIRVNGQLNKNAAWYYPNPSDAASQIKGYVAFWRGVEVIP